MAQEQEQNKRSQQLENARVGYQVAASLWIYEGGLIWSKFNALLVANSIILTAIGLAMSAPAGVRILPDVFSISMPILGIILCVFWWGITRRSFLYHRCWVLSAREAEELFLKNAVRTATRGGALARGEDVEFDVGGPPNERTIYPLQSFLRVETAAYIMICLFGLLYVILLTISSAILLNRL
jgi:hypothetical protein